MVATSPKNASFTKSLFFGNILEEMVFPYPQMSKEEKETVNILVDSFKKYAEKNIDTTKIDREEKISPEVMSTLSEMGLFGMIIPEKYGGSGLSATAYARVMQEVCSVDASLGVTFGGHQSIGLKGIILFGTEAQKKKYLPDLATGKKMAAFALTEPEAGSDAAGIKTKAILSEDKKHYILNGSKIWITNGGIADVFTVFAKTEEPDEKEGQGNLKKWKITAFIVTRDMGVRNGPEEHKMGIRGSSTTELYFENCKVPAENILGEPGKGFKVAMEILNNGRLGLAAGCIGGAKKAIKLATTHATTRKQFGKSIAEFGMIQDKIANITMDTFAAESMIYMTTALIDRGVEDYSLESAICKIFSSESAWRVINEAVQIGAGIAYMREYPYEQLLRDARINIIFEGTNEILRCFTALAGMQGPGQYLKEVGQAMRYPLKGIGPLSDFAVKKISRDIVGLGDRITKADIYLKKETALIEDYVKYLATAVEKTLMKHQKTIWEKEFVQRRIANAVIDLYAMICTVSRTTSFIQKDGLAKSKYVIQLCQSFCDRASRRIKRNLRSMDGNDDERLKDLSNQTCALSGYPFDIL
ncbi:MAG: acyl-CoA dehydrogenase [Deltaproteobacteria bacterium GWA2_38_16]|nr:MAG: acyl-CoA dehydrogenase [Deltaproteobacteria bacterium GWA2_38_16]OGQ03190.1 MAG: acyl-CoA dehydrogenase [Deltaproteobacteria bacterium RIFCSPHIGHO2_02_FULL_38_15]OGQ34672.1 MAG: acyl-CoA dehydrogenase [Deltaproteobacteria bacterium RIFCSPLOWO2_01_FULL_38_9]OGQ60182.1 MAG: acyl-CoA dehydrogenase [Deltaproteobacteria bacterium RIFCSPLOWO2_12_FULL_38_8]HBQ20384.1 acyl-CoA dehydrogenase [Deltaproteobacteria bacterium]